MVVKVRNRNLRVLSNIYIKGSPPSSSTQIDGLVLTRFHFTRANNRLIRHSHIPLQECFQLSVCLSVIIPSLLKLPLQLLRIPPQLLALFAATCINDLSNFLAHSLARSLRRKSIPQHGLQPIHTCPNFNELKGNLEIATQVSGDGWLVAIERPTNPVNGWAIIMSMSTGNLTTTRLTLVSQIQATQSRFHFLHA
jgi:hypothetical protein